MKSVDDLMRALKDCGCDGDTATAVVACIERGEKARALDEIALHRKRLLEGFHRCDSCISRIDLIAAEIERA